MQKYYLAAIGILALTLLVMGVISYRAKGQATEYLRKAAENQGRIDVLDEQLAIRNKTISSLNESLKIEKESNALLQKKLDSRPVPPPPGPPPVTNEEMKVALVGLGMHPGLRFSVDDSSIFSEQDSKKIWKLGAEASLVPVLRLNIADRDHLIKGQKTEIVLWETRGQESDAALALSMQANSEQTRQNENLKQAIKKNESNKFWRTLRDGGIGTALGILIKSLAK